MQIPLELVATEARKVGGGGGGKEIANLMGT